MVLCDCGANAECTPEYLLQFAYLGNFYAQRVLGVEKPRVALLNIGAEDEKGDILRHETLPLLKAADAEGRLHFIGSVESSDAMRGKADVIVADGFSGNVMLKSIEGTAKFLSGEIKGMLLASWKTKLAALLMKVGLKRFKAMLDPSEVGGTAFLGHPERHPPGPGFRRERLHPGHRGEHRLHEAGEGRFLNFGY